VREQIGAQVQRLETAAQEEPQRLAVAGRA
jgi:hypothetical protein